MRFRREERVMIPSPVYRACPRLDRGGGLDWGASESERRGADATANV